MIDINAMIHESSIAGTSFRVLTNHSSIPPVPFFVPFFFLALGTISCCTGGSTTKHNDFPYIENPLYSVFNVGFASSPSSSNVKFLVYSSKQPLRGTRFGAYTVENGVCGCGGEKEYAGVEFGFVDVISCGLFVVLFGVFFFEFGDYEWTDRGDEFLRRVSFSSGGGGL